MLTVNEAEQPHVISNEFPIFLKTKNNSRGQHMLPTFSECSVVSKKDPILLFSYQGSCLFKFNCQNVVFLYSKKYIYTREGD